MSKIANRFRVAAVPALVLGGLGLLVRLKRRPVRGALWTGARKGGLMMRVATTGSVLAVCLLACVVWTGESRGGEIEVKVSVPLIGHWDFEEGGGRPAGDSSPNHLDGTIFNATYVNVKGSGPTKAIGTYALAFNGSDTYVRVGNSDLLAPETIGIAVWFKCPPQAGFHDLLDKGHGSGSTPYASGYVIQGFYNDLSAMYGNGSDFPGIGVPFDVYDDKWHHLVANLGKDAIELYVDTIPVAGGGPGAGPIVQNDSDLFFGRHRALGRYYSGLLADIRLYDGALSQEDVIKLFNTPEPATLTLLVLGGLGILFRKRK